MIIIIMYRKKIDKNEKDNIIHTISITIKQQNTIKYHNLMSSNSVMSLINNYNNCDKMKKTNK